MEDMPDSHTQQAFRYSAFISYSHLDAAFARRLHRRLETYRLPRHLAQGRADATRRLKPIFRDRDELSAAPDLSAAVREAIAEAPYLIVICSQHAQNSAWVAREVALFRQIHGNAAVLAVLLDGCTDDHLRAMLGARTSAGHDIEPLAADFRRHGDGNRLAFLKLVAVLAGVRLDQLIQRDAQRRVRQIAISGISACIGVSALAGLAVVAVRNQEDAKHHHIIGALLIHDLIAARDKAKAAGRLDILRALTQSALKYYASMDRSDLSPTDSMQLAGLLQESGEDDEKRGDYEHARTELSAAATITGNLLKTASDNTDYIFAEAQSEFWLGENAWRVGEYSTAERRFLTYASLADRLVQTNRGNPDWLMEQGYAQSNLGTFVLRQKIDLPRAERYYSAALSSFRAAESHRPGDFAIIQETVEAYNGLGDVKRLSGDCSGAANYRSRASKLLSNLKERDPHNADIASASIANTLALARIDLCRNAPFDALRKLERGHADAAALYEGDPVNEDLRQQTRIFDLFKVQTWLSLPDKERPSIDLISKTLGNCNAEYAIKNNDELATYCSILQRRLSIVTGSAIDASRSLGPAEPASTFVRDGLTAWWGLNFKNEERLTLDIQSRKDGIK
jgi:hypothetical protein